MRIKITVDENYRNNWKQLRIWFTLWIQCDALRMYRPICKQSNLYVRGAILYFYVISTWIKPHPLDSYRPSILISRIAPYFIHLYYSDLHNLPFIFTIIMEAGSYLITNNNKQSYKCQLKNQIGKNFQSYKKGYSATFRDFIDSMKHLLDMMRNWFKWYLNVWD